MNLFLREAKYGNQKVRISLVYYVLKVNRKGVFYYSELIEMLSLVILDS